MKTIRTRTSVAAFAFIAAVLFAPGSLQPGANAASPRKPALTCLDVYPDHVIVATGLAGERQAAARGRP